MTDRPIIFSAPMIKALLAGTKTQTRRMLTPPYQGATLQCTPNGTWKWWLSGSDQPHRTLIERFAPGDRLWVREAIDKVSWPGDVFYRADYPGKSDGLGWRPSIHMPRWASRLTLTVTDVRVQRLQDISEADAWAEGCKQGAPDDVGGYFPAEEPTPDGKGEIGWDCASDWYADLWNSLHGAEAWDANPWVVAVSFTVAKGNIDEVPG